MDIPLLKSHWERFKAHVDINHEMATDLLRPFTVDPIERIILLSDGCANTNYKIEFKTNHLPIVLRIYVREKSAAFSELKIHQLVENIIPVPKHLYLGKERPDFHYPYSVMEWVEGKNMRDVIMTKDEKSISECLFEAGVYLDKFRNIKFNHGGFFDENFNIRPFNQEEEYLPFVLNMLKDKIVIESLGENLHLAVTQLVNNNANILPNEDEASLTHADYDPSNMLVKQVNGKWKISAILDWEFSFAGTYLLDIGMMLRYSHRLPACYEEKFIEGIQSSGHVLPKEWKKQSKLMDLLCLLQLAHYNPHSERPKLNRDVVSLIADTVTHWSQF